MKKSFIYDLTCLLYQQVFETPTGTTRVDLRYAQYFLTRHRATTVFVKQQGNRLLVISNHEAEALINHLLGTWEIGENPQADPAFRRQSNLEFRLKHPGLWSVDLDTFYSMPFRDRFNFILNQELTEILGFGPEFEWANRLPHVLKICITLIGSFSKYPALFLMRSGQFIGTLLRTGSLMDAFRIVSGRQTATEYLLDRIGKNPAEKYVYVYTAYNRGFPVDALVDIRRVASLECCIFIHDLISIYYSEYFLPVNQQKQITSTKRLLDLKPDLITNSEGTRACIERFASEHQLMTGKLTTAYIGVEPGFLAHRHIKPEEKGAPYFVFISTIEPRKNHILLLNVWREMAQKRLVDPMPHLFLVGKRGWEYENIIDMIERSGPLRGLVHEAASLDDSQLIALLKGARALLFPTFCEGWGMPVVESLTVGTPVICSDIPELRESGQGIPDYIHPIDGKGWMEVIIDYCQPDSSLRNAQLQRISRFEPPSWERHFEHVSREMFQNCAAIKAR